MSTPYSVSVPNFEVSPSSDHVFLPCIPTALTTVSQVHVLQRTAAGWEFDKLLASADVILHPFPFGGSKTAADGLALGVPVVAMAGDMLPGRMAYSLYRSMALELAGDRGCCVTKDRDR